MGGKLPRGLDAPALGEPLTVGESEVIAGLDFGLIDFRKKVAVLQLKHDRRTWLIEVKSSQGDRCQFEMGESEVRAAREAAQPRSGQRYVVIYVANPATSSTTRIDILPNPMSEEADGILRLLGEGVRFRRK